MEDKQELQAISAEVAADALEAVIDAAFDGNKSGDVPEAYYAMVLAMLGHILAHQEEPGVREMTYQVARVASKLWGQAKVGGQRVVTFVDEDSVRMAQKEAN